MLQFLIRLLSRLACRLSRQRLLLFGSLLATLLYRLYRLSPYRNVIQHNIQQALAWPAYQAQQLAQRHIERLVWSIAEFLRFPRWQQEAIIPYSDLTIEGFHHLLNAHRKGQGVVVVSAHYGFWELIPAVMALYGLPVHVLVQPPTVPAFEALFRENRAGLGIQTHNNTVGLRPLLRCLEQGEIVALVADQHGESNQVIGTFFEQTVAMPEGPVFFAAHCHSPIVPVFIHRAPQHRHVIRFYPPLAVNPHQPIERQYQPLMQQLYTLFESRIRTHPEEWLWSYNRWDKYHPV